MKARTYPIAIPSAVASTIGLLVLTDCGGTATLIPRADNTLEIIGNGYNEESALEAALAKGEDYCRQLGKSFATIDQRSGYQGIDPALKTAINVAAMVSKEPVYGMGNRSDDWRIQLTGKCQ